MLGLNSISQTDSLLPKEIKTNIIYNNKLIEEKIITQAPLYKYYIYTEALGLINGVNLNFEINFKKIKHDYFRIWLGIQKDDYKSQNYPKYNGVYNYYILIFYTLIKNKQKISYEFAPGIYGGYGDPYARDNFALGFNDLKYTAGLVISAGIRFNIYRFFFKTTYLPQFGLIEKKIQPIGASISIGYSFKRIKNDQKKIQTYSNTDY